MTHDNLYFSVLSKETERTHDTEPKTYGFKDAPWGTSTFHIVIPNEFFLQKVIGLLGRRYSLASKASLAIVGKPRVSKTSRGNSTQVFLTVVIFIII